MGFVPVTKWLEYVDSAYYGSCCGADWSQEADRWALPIWVLRALKSLRWMIA